MLKFISKTIVILIPVILIYIAVECYVRNIEYWPTITSRFYQNTKSETEILIVGASQNQYAINGDFLTNPSLNIAYPKQDYYTILKLVERLLSELPNLKTVILPKTYGHLETGSPQKDTWRNVMYKYYFDVTISEKFSYFKDELLYLSYPNYYTELIRKDFDNTLVNDYSARGFDYNQSRSLFYKKKYDSLLIVRRPLKLRSTSSDKNVFIQNSYYLRQLLDLCQSLSLQVVFAETPVTTIHKDEQIRAVNDRRDSLFEVLSTEYSFRTFKPEKYNSYYLRHFRDHNHLNPSGAKQFTISLDSFMNN